MNTTEETSQNSIEDMVEQIRQQEQADQDRERGIVVRDFKRPTIGKQPKQEEPATRKKYIPIRARDAYKKLLGEAAKKMTFLELVCSRRNVFDVDDEAKALEEVSKATYRALQFIKDKQAERKAEKGAGVIAPNEDDSGEGEGEGDKTGNDKGEQAESCRVPVRIPDGNRKK